MNNNPEFYFEGFRICLNNAKRLTKIASMAGAEQDYGIGCSMNILAGEEAIKAAGVILWPHSDVKEAEGFNKLFREHKVKHKALIETSPVLALIADVLYSENGWMNMFYDLLGQLMEKVSAAEKELYVIEGKPFLDLLAEHIKPTSQKLREQEGKAWWDKANDLKNAGFYAGLLKGQWYDPASITKETFDLSAKYTKSILDNVEKMPDMLEQAKKFNEDKKKGN